jgi:pimeloyl-ACP methyl ester carboxylesterase
MLVVHGDSDAYFGVEHARMLAAAAPVAELWIERGMGHAESATTPGLLDRIDDWARRAVGASATMAR